MTTTDYIMLISMGVIFLAVGFVGIYLEDCDKAESRANSSAGVRER